MVRCDDHAMARTQATTTETDTLALGGSTEPTTSMAPSRSSVRSILLSFAACLMACGPAECTRQASLALHAMTAPPPGARDYRGAACGPRLDRMDARLRSVDLDKSGLLFGKSSQWLPFGELGEPAVDPAPMLEIKRSRVALDGEELDAPPNPELVAARLDVLARNWSILHPDTTRSEHPYYVLAEPDLPAALVLSWLPDPSRRHAPRIVVRQPWTGPYEPRPPGAPEHTRAVLRRLAEIPDFERPAYLAEQMNHAGAGCEPLNELRRSMAERPPSYELYAIVVDGLARAIRACGCAGVDVDLLEGLWVAVIAPPGPPTKWLPMRDIPRDGSSLPEDATVNDLVRHLAPQRGGIGGLAR